ncbi:hypothetical protein HK104_009250 [Borealophlyctis nickersoniae]|nr:hypothetical protein HK104_009250 [Borealophlyctis nickersoniae]
MYRPLHVFDRDDYEVASSIGDAERNLHSELGDENDDRWDDWEEEEAESQCPFCPAKISPPSAAFEHCRVEHAFDFKQTRKQLGLDFYGSIRLINYVRTEAKRNPSLSSDQIISAGKNAAWIEDDTFLQPVVDDDPLLYAFEDEDDDDLQSALASSSLTPQPSSTSQSSESTQLQEALQRATLAERRLEELQRAFEQYKELVKKTFLDDRIGHDPWANPVKGSKVEHEEGDEEWQMDYYFGSYAETEIHESMLKDTVRTESYRDFIYNNKGYFKGKIVLDVGCGTGILSMFAARAGAAKVYAVDNSTIINKARKIAAENGLEDTITFVQGKVEEITLPVDNVDIIISEWMGYFLLYEGMLDSVLHARDRWLAPDGIMAPSRTDMLIAAIDDAEWVNDKYHFWNDVYGFKMQTMKHGFLTDGQVDFADPKTIVSDTATIKQIDIATTTPTQLDFSTPFRLTITAASARVNALVGWFDTYFAGQDEDGADLETVFFSTGPTVKGTHWKQTLFAFEEGVDVVKGSVLEGTFKCVKSGENHRELVVDVEFTVTSPTGEKGAAIKRSYQVR